MAKTTTIAGNTFLFTGKLTEFTREDAEAHVEAEGGKVLSGVSAKLNYLVVGEDAGSKLAKAKALGTVTILHEKEFLKMMKKKTSVKSSSKTTTATKNTVTKKAEKNVVAITATKANTVNKETDSVNEITIGKQIWMAKNLDVMYFRNGDPIPEVNDNNEWQLAFNKKAPAWCYFNYKSSNGVKLGKLYNWFAVNDKRGLAPEGWKIPTTKDWMKLNSILGDQAGKKMKSKAGWESKGNGNNESNFNAIPGSNGRNGMGMFSGASSLTVQKGYVFYWASNQDRENVKYANSVYLTYDDDVLHFETTIKSFGLSVRCIK